MKKIYISGQISGQPWEETVAKFQVVEDRLKGQGHEVVNPLKNGLSVTATWEEHLALDIVHLLKCDAIYMLANWRFSRGATLEKNIAEMTGKEVIYETTPDAALQRIMQAIYDEMGISFVDIAGNSREQKTVFARIIFSHLCRTEEKATIQRIAKEINKSHTSVMYYLKKYQNDILYTPLFRQYVEAVTRNLKDNNNEKY